jgi:hypothetical protein
MIYINVYISGATPIAIVWDDTIRLVGKFNHDTDDGRWARLIVI